jgi:hypothetical protein
VVIPSPKMSGSSSLNSLTSLMVGLGGLFSMTCKFCLNLISYIYKI